MACVARRSSTTCILPPYITNGTAKKSSPTFAQLLALCAGMSYSGKDFKNIWACATMILCDTHLRWMLPQIIPNAEERDENLVNPASIDIRLGKSVVREDIYGDFVTCELGDGRFADCLMPGEFILISTFERICVPNGFALDLRLKSSTARKGYNHSLAFWVDPGWDGYLTMEVQNIRRYGELPLIAGMRFAQIIVHQLTAVAENPYSGKYQGATGVEASKGE